MWQRPGSKAVSHKTNKKLEAFKLFNEQQQKKPHCLMSFVAAEEESMFNNGL